MCQHILAHWLQYRRTDTRSSGDQRETGAPIDASKEEDDPTIFKSISNGPELRKHVEKVTHFLDRVKHGYEKDALFAKVIKERYPSFKYRDRLLYTNNRGGQEVLCIPRVIT
jgi:hypothetical protein